MFRKLNHTADRIEALLVQRRAPARVVGGRVLPAFVELLLQPHPNTRVSQIRALQADLALALGVANLRLTQSGAHLALQIPRQSRQPVRLDALLRRLPDIPRFTAVLGVAEDGAPLLAHLPAPEVAHMLIAGTTGAGKTALAHSVLLSLATRHRPSQLGIVMLDPKLHAEQVTAALRAHLLLPPAREPQAALAALQRVVQVMERRDLRREPLPRVVVFVDELADVCQTGGAAVMELLTRIAQRGREAGVHLVACTQKPSARAIGSLLKANLPLRLVGRVLSAHDAQLASGMAGTGAEKLLGSGDFLAVSAGGVTRFQAALPVLGGE